MRSPQSAIPTRIASRSSVWADRKKTTPMPSGSVFERRTYNRQVLSGSRVRSSQAASVASLRLIKPSRITDAIAMSTSSRLLAGSAVSARPPRPRLRGRYATARIAEGQ